MLRHYKYIPQLQKSDAKLMFLVSPLAILIAKNIIGSLRWILSEGVEKET